MKLGLAAASYELVGTIPSILAYFGPDRKKTWLAIAAHEQELSTILLEYLNKREDITVYSEPSPASDLRVPVISFSVKGKSSKEIVEKVDACSDFGIRWGHFYSKRMIDDLLGLKEEGVIRVSMVHYNTGTLRLAIAFGSHCSKLTCSFRARNQRFSVCTRESPRLNLISIHSKFSRSFNESFLTSRGQYYTNILSHSIGHQADMASTIIYPLSSDAAPFLEPK